MEIKGRKKKTFYDEFRETLKEVSSDREAWRERVMHDATGINNDGMFINPATREGMGFNVEDVAAAFENSEPGVQDLISYLSATGKTDPSEVFTASDMDLTDVKFTMGFKDGKMRIDPIGFKGENIVNPTGNETPPASGSIGKEGDSLDQALNEAMEGVKSYRQRMSREERQEKAEHMSGFNFFDKMQDLWHRYANWLHENGNDYVDDSESKFLGRRCSVFNFNMVKDELDDIEQTIQRMREQVNKGADGDFKDKMNEAMDDVVDSVQSQKDYLNRQQEKAQGMHVADNQPDGLIFTDDAETISEDLQRNAYKFMNDIDDMKQNLKDHMFASEAFSKVFS